MEENLSKIVWQAAPQTEKVKKEFEPPKTEEQLLQERGFSARVELVLLFTSKRNEQLGLENKDDFKRWKSDLIIGLKNILRQDIDPVLKSSIQTSLQLIELDISITIGGIGDHKGESVFVPANWEDAPRNSSVPATIELDYSGVSQTQTTSQTV